MNKIHVLMYTANKLPNLLAFSNEGKLRVTIENILDSYNLESFKNLTNLEEVNDHFGTDYKVFELFVQ